MKRIPKRDLMLEVRKCGFDISTIFDMPVIRPYHYHEWDHGYYSWGAYEGTRREFYEDLRDMVDFLYQYMDYHNMKEVIVAPLHNYNIFVWDKGIEDDDTANDIYKETMELLRKNRVSKNSQAGIKFKIEGNKRIIELILEGNYRGILQFCLFFPDKGIIIEPTHHFDLKFFTNNFEVEKTIIKNVIINHKNLRYYDFVM